jgi:hypothetical protein
MPLTTADQELEALDLLTDEELMLHAKQHGRTVLERALCDRLEEYILKSLGAVSAVSPITGSDLTGGVTRNG